MNTILLLPLFLVVLYGCSHQEKRDGIDRNAVRTAVRNSLSAFKSCYDPEYKKDNKLAGKVVLVWDIHAGGKAKKVMIVEEKTTLQNVSLHQCLIETMVQIQFPEPPEGTIAEVTYPFLFSGTVPQQPSQ